LHENMSLATFKTKLKTYLFQRSQWLLKTTRRCWGFFAISVSRYKWLYSLNYLSGFDFLILSYQLLLLCC